METQELIQFPHLEAVLRDFGERVVALYEDELIKNKKNASYKLANSLEYIYEREGSTFSVSVKLEHYWKYIEEGIAPAGKYKNPGFKSYPAILEWVKVKPVAPKPMANGKLPTTQQLAYLISRKIKDKGIEPQPLMANAVEKAVNALYNDIADAITQDLDNIANVMIINYLSR